ncbi:unnamed protein product [Lactuca virosa]|uniref:Uncharacterized protein n=1 Tax=Lactuca virosa TaxID=75947 RepID=A0AAU9NQ06_9ASTR|nr:unnamed protein product [Lactuca virosa]
MMDLPLHNSSLLVLPPPPSSPLVSPADLLLRRLQDNFNHSKTPPASSFPFPFSFCPPWKRSQIELAHKSLSLTSQWWCQWSIEAEIDLDLSSVYSLQREIATDDDVEEVAFAQPNPSTDDDDSLRSVSRMQLLKTERRQIQCILNSNGLPYFRSTTFPL